MIFGTRDTLAFEVERAPDIGNWVYVQFRLWLKNEPVGNFEDHVVLSIARARMRDFANFEGKRREKGLEDLSAEQLYSLLFDSVMISIPPGMTVDEAPDNTWETPPYEKIVERFHLYAVGDCALEGIANVLLVELPDGRERVVWRDPATGNAREVFLPAHSFADAAAPFLKWADEALGARGPE